MTTHTESLTSDQRKALKRPDEFVTVATGLFDRLAGNGKALLAGVIVLLLIGAGGTVAYQMREKKLEDSRNAFFQAQKALEDELKTAMAALPKPAAPAKPTKPGETTPPPAAPSPEEILYKKLNPATTFPKAIAAYQKVVADFSGTRVAFESQVALGNLYLRHGEPSEAAQWLRKAAASAPSASDQGMAWMGVGAAEESLGKFKEAGDAYRSAQNSGDATVRGQALLATARVFEATKDIAQARATYDQILSQMAGTEAAKAAETAKALLE